MLLENPFFIRELRSKSRRRFMPYALFLGLCVLPLLLPVWLTDFRRTPDSWDEMRMRGGIILFAVGLIHPAMCYAAGWELGRRAFSEEARQNTLETLRLVSMRPITWLPMKLALPIYGTLLVWAAPTPLYLCLANRMFPLIRPATLEPVFQLALIAGAAGLAGGLLAPPESNRIRNLLGARLNLSSFVANFARTGLSGWIVLVLLGRMLDWLWGSFSHQPMFRTRPFFSGSLSTETEIYLLVGTFLLAGLLTSWVYADPVNRLANRMAVFSRNLSVWTAYGLFMGFSWPGAQPWARWLMALIPVGLLMGGWWGTRATRRKEDRIAARELAWLHRHVDNPVFIRDLRVMLRSSGLTRQSLVVLLQVVAGSLLIGGLSWGIARLFGGVLGQGNETMAAIATAAGSAMFIAYLLLIPTLLGMGTRGAKQWVAERRQDTVTQLLQTPLSPGTIVRGRWAASLMITAVRALPLVLVLATGCVVILGLEVMEGRLSLSLEPVKGFGTALCWFGAAGLLVSAGQAGPGAGARRGLDPFSAYALALYLLMGEFFVLFATLFVPDELRWIPIEHFFPMYVVGTAVLNAAAAFFIHTRAVADVERLRRAGID